MIAKGTGYFLEKVYWGNGGYLTFYDEENYLNTLSSIRLYPNKETKVIDYHNKVYYVTLTTEKAKK